MNSPNLNLWRWAASPSKSRTTCCRFPLIARRKNLRMKESTLHWLTCAQNYGKKLHFIPLPKLHSIYRRKPRTSLSQTKSMKSQLTQKRESNNVQTRSRRQSNSKNPTLKTWTSSRKKQTKPSSSTQSKSPRLTGSLWRFTNLRPWKSLVSTHQDQRKSALRPSKNPAWNLLLKRSSCRKRRRYNLCSQSTTKPAIPKDLPCWPPEWSDWSKSHYRLNVVPLRLASSMVLCGDKWKSAVSEGTAAGKGGGENLMNRFIWKCYL